MPIDPGGRRCLKKYREQDRPLSISTNPHQIPLDAFQPRPHSPKKYFDMYKHADTMQRSKAWEAFLSRSPLFLRCYHEECRALFLPRTSYRHPRSRQTVSTVEVHLAALSWRNFWACHPHTSKRTDEFVRGRCCRHPRDFRELGMPHII